MHGSVSVVIPTVSRASARAAVASALRQTCPPLEVIVAVDSADASVHPLLQDCADSVEIVLTGGIGPSGARMRGVAQARGQIVAFLDDDDEWLPDKLERQLALWPGATDRHAHALISCGLVMVGDDGQILRRIPFKTFDGHERLTSYLFRRNRLSFGEGVIHPSSIICDRALVDSEPWDPNVSRHEDWDWLLRVGERRDVAIRMCPDVLVRVAGAGRSTEADWRSSLMWIRERADHLSPRERADFLLCHTATSAIRGRSRKGGVIAAWQAVRCGRAGAAAWVVWLMHMISPALVDSASRFKNGLSLRAEASRPEREHRPDSAIETLASRS